MIGLVIGLHFGMRMKLKKMIWKTKKTVPKEENKKGKKAFRLRKQLEEEQQKEMKEYESSRSL